MAPPIVADLRLVGALAIALGTLVASYKVVPVVNDCPKTPVGSIPIKFPHETDCTKFYGCIGGSKLATQCPTIDAQGNRFYFNPVTQLCDWPNNVDCKPPRPIAAIPSPVTQPTECPTYNSLNYTVNLAHERDCAKFYKCDWGRKISFDCPFCNKDGERLHFNPVLQVCDWPQNVQCGQFSPGLTPCSGHTGGVIAVPGNGCIGTCPIVDNGYYNLLLANIDRKKFCICSNGVGHVYDCPKDSHWNNLSKICTF